MTSARLNRIGIPRAAPLRVGAKRFEELRAWQLAARLSDEVVTARAMPELKADLSFREQLRRAAESAPRLIAEGFGRWTHKEFARYLIMTRSELMEVRSDLRALERRRALPSKVVADLLELTEHTTNTVDKLRNSLDAEGRTRRKSRSSTN